MKSYNTNSILESDFKTFPPKPLSFHPPKPINIRLKKFHKFSIFINNLKERNLLVNMKINNEDLNKSVFFKKGMGDTQKLESLESSFNAMPSNKLILILFKIISPLLAIFSKSFKKNMNRALHSESFVEALQKDTIYYKSEPEEHLLSHENIHILQYRKFAYLYKLLKFNPNDLIDRDENLTPELKFHLNYIFEQSEFEARLHELVICIYIRDGVLPLTTKDIISKFINITELMCNEKQVIRSQHFESDLCYIFSLFHDANKEEFLYFILIPLLYSNLLLYYGDFISSYKIKRNIINRSTYTKENGFHFK